MGGLDFSASTSGAAIHLYLGLLDEIDRPQVRAACFEMLSQAERDRLQRFLLERDRRQFLLAHGMVRAALSRRVPAVSPAEWAFVSDHYNRPFVATPQTSEALYFSLSHTTGCVACTISPDKRIGVDVEATDRDCSHLGIAELNFSSAENAALRELPPAKQPDRFFDYWTLKEAYLKAHGTGFHRPLDDFSIVFEPERPIRISFHPGSDDVPQRWWFTQASPSPRHRLAIADGSGRPGGLPIVSQPWPIV